MQVIDTGWTFRTDPSAMGEAQGWTKGPPAGSQPIAIPSLWTTVAAPGYSGAAWYWREIDPPGAWTGQTIRIRFEAVAENADVWLNGQKLGSHRGGATPFAFDITKIAKVGARSLLAVRVEGSVEHGAGMWQGVLLMAHDEAYITDIFPYGGPLGNLAADIGFFNSSDKSGDAELEARILLAGTANAEVKKSNQILSLTPGLNVTSMLVNVAKKRVQPWTPNTPSLYYLDLAFRQQKDVLDTTETTFGFRDFGWRDGGMTINGEAILPKAISPELSRHVIIATETDTNSARALLKRVKGAGVNVIYLEAPPPALLALADEEGLLVVEGARKGLAETEARVELLDLIRRDRAHACVLAWNLRDLNAGVFQEARKLDPSRFILKGVGNKARLFPPHADTEEAAFTPPPGLAP